MLLGLTQWCYMWFIGSPNLPYFIPRDSAGYDHRGLARPYFLTTPTHVSEAVPSDAFEWFLRRCAELNRDAEIPITVAHGALSGWDDPRYLDRIRATLQKERLEFVPAVSADIVCTGDRACKGQEAAIQIISRYRDFGGIRVTKFNSRVGLTRFHRELPLDEQLALLKENVLPIVQAAGEAGIVLALENHFDYRAREIVGIIEHVNSPFLRSLLDFGSPFAVCEEPVEAARLLAPYVVLAHIKDVRVVPWTPETGAYHACQYLTPLGRGNVDLKAIVTILQEKAPAPERLALALENVPVPPQEDEDRWVVESVGWMRRELAAYLSA